MVTALLFIFKSIGMLKVHIVKTRNNEKFTVKMVHLIHKTYDYYLQIP